MTHFSFMNLDFDIALALLGVAAYMFVCGMILPMMSKREVSADCCGKKTPTSAVGVYKSVAFVLTILVWYWCGNEGMMPTDQQFDAKDLLQTSAPEPQLQQQAPSPTATNSINVPALPVMPMFKKSDHSGKLTLSSSTAVHIPLERQLIPLFQVGEVMYYKSAYYGLWAFGSRGDVFKVCFDTGSGHIILPSTYCFSAACKAHRRYSRKLSVTGKDIDFDGTEVGANDPRDEVTVGFGTGEVSGVFVSDVVCVDGKAPFASQKEAQEGGPLRKGCMRMRFIAATEMSEDPFTSFQFDGILGLGLRGLSQTREFNFLEMIADNIAAEGGTTPNIFAVFLADSPDEASDITFGGWAKNHIRDEIAWNNVIEKEMGHWLLGIRSVLVDGEELEICKAGNCRAVADTGTSHLSVPSEAYPELFEYLKHPAHRKGHCEGSAGPRLEIVLDNFTISLGPREYSRIEFANNNNAWPIYEPQQGLDLDDERRWGKPTRSDMYCKPMLMSIDVPAPVGPKVFILGEPILRKYYTIYNSKEGMIGFSRAVHHRRGKEIDYDRVGNTEFDRLEYKPSRIFGALRHAATQKSQR